MTDKTIEAYEKIAKYFHETHLEPIYSNEIKEFVSLLQGKEVVEIGCGTGRDAKVLTSLGVHYTGIDASSEMIAIAKKRVNGTFFVMNFYNLDLPKKSFDGFVAFASLLHIPKSKLHDVLISIKSIVKANGMGFITVKEKTTLDEGVIVQEELGIERYFAFYTLEEFSQQLLKAGYTIIKTGNATENDGTRWLLYFVRIQ